MQSVVRSTKNIHQIFNDIEAFYTYTSEKKNHKSIVPLTVDNSFVDLVLLFEDYGDFECDVNFVDKKYSQIDIPKSDKKNIILAFSGGKDSTATALHYMDRGYNVTLYHLRGINQTYKDEYKTVQVLADKLKLPLIIEQVSLTGSHCWTEHPMKNMVIANSMIQYCLRNNLPVNIAFGNFKNSTLEDEPFGVCGGDCFEMWKAYEAIIHTVFPNLYIHVPFESMRDTWTNIFNHAEYAPFVQSCIGPYRYREYLKSKNEEKYHVKLFDHRCGSCWKCALEYCVYADKGIIEYNAGFYSHCLEILKKTYKKEHNIKPTIDDLWKNYFIYPRKESKYFKDEI